jgi:ADP-ribosylglycohydrolase
MAPEFAIDRSLGALAGVAIGDAMGMPTQTMSTTEILQHYGRVTDFTAPCPAQRVSAGLHAAMITDDMEQTVLLAQHLIANDGMVDQALWAQTLLDWERNTHARGINDLLGPSTKRAIDALLNGASVEDAGRQGTTNGAAMRIAPLGIATAPEPLGGLLDAVEDCCKLTHNTGVSIASAAAVAVVISLGINGVGFRQALPLAIAIAREGERRGAVPMEGSFLPKLQAAIALADSADEITGIAERIGTSVAACESVPMAFAIACRADGNLWEAAVASANIGDDTDTMGAIACSMIGAGCGLRALPIGKWMKVKEANKLELGNIAAELLKLRNRSSLNVLKTAS